MKSDNILHALTPAQKKAIDKALETIAKNREQLDIPVGRLRKEV